MHDALQTGMQSLDEVQKAVALDELREKFAHNDRDLERRFRDRVNFLVAAAILFLAAGSRGLGGFLVMS